MIDSLLLAQAPGAPSPATQPSLAESLTKDAAGLASVPTDLAVPFLQHLAQAMPVADVVVGGGMLMLILLIHATGVRVVIDFVAKRTRIILQKPSAWRVDILMSGAVLLLLCLHLTETIVWAAALVYGGLVTSWRAAGFFAGNTYTTVGYGAFVLPPGWEMLAPIIAISGLFTFGWSGSVLVDIVARCQRVKDVIAGHTLPQPAVPPEKPA